MVGYVEAMGILRRVVTSRSSKLGLLSDLALVGTAATRFARQRSGPGSGQVSPVDTLIAGGAAVRLVARVFGRRRSK